MEIVNWKYYIVEKEISKIINKYITENLKVSYTAYCYKSMQRNSYLSWSLPRWGYSRTQQRFDVEYLEGYSRMYSRKTFGGSYNFSLANLDTLLRLKIRREKADIVYDYADLIVECVAIFNDEYIESIEHEADYVTLKKNNVAALLLIIDYLIIEIFYKITLVSKFAFYEVSRKVEDETLTIFGSSFNPSRVNKLMPKISLNTLDFAPKVSAWKNYDPSFTLKGKNILSMEYKPKNLNKGFSWGAYKYKI